MIPRPWVRWPAMLVAFALVPAVAGAQPSEPAPPATHSPLDPVRLAGDFAPLAPTAPAVESFEQAAYDSSASPADSLAPADSIPASVPPTLPAGPLMGAAPVEPPPLVGSIVGALVGGAVGLYGGALLGYAAVGGDDDYYYGDYEEVGVILLGASLGEMFLMPAGAHLGNGGQGSYWTALGGSALGYVATLAFSYAGPIGSIAGVLLQTALTVSGERRSAKRRAAEKAAGIDSP